MTEEENQSWKIAITGGTGMIGSAVRKSLEKAGHEVRVISRSGDEGTILWQPDEGKIDEDALTGTDAVIHLAGEPIAQRWTGEVRERIYSSRVRSTRLLVRALRDLPTPPKVFLSASGINFYPPTPMGAQLDESAGEGTDFLSRVCHHWEGEARKAEEFIPRVCRLRTAVVLSPEGGALAKLLPIFKSGVGGRIGSGEQPFPWISLEDYTRICLHLIFQSSYSGAVNLVAPDAVTNEEFVKTLADALDRPAVLPVPKVMVRMAFGEMGISTLYEGVDAAPAVLQADSFEFRHPKLGPALAEILG
ncbi:TIGR01777 family oxidoreductase [Puniceicoccus vermicola]|uniref:TIGR01777 family protein n=1 Tax=Puniceicoccus vermicola TaxID=388746 RepID=A0A7X1B287_9BACT|nr:TIGR01777 family oxidoreductase [Puniceicoccus vermicola]MBC2604289.1 TIGR01777 family protein [Puniceicoccus vermicola]